MQGFNLTWAQFKTVVDDRNLSVQYLDIDNKYYMTAFDGPMQISCHLDKNDSLDQTDFEINYKLINRSNKRIGFSTSLPLINRSGTTSATPSTSTQIMAENLNRKYLFIQNVGTTTIWIDFTNSAVLTQPSISLDPGASFVMEGTSVSYEVINVISKGVSVPYTAKEK